MSESLDVTGSWAGAGVSLNCSIRARPRCVLGRVPARETACAGESSSILRTIGLSKRARSWGMWLAHGRSRRGPLSPAPASWMTALGPCWGGRWLGLSTYLILLIYPATGTPPSRTRQEASRNERLPASPACEYPYRDDGRRLSQACPSPLGARPSRPRQQERGNSPLVGA